MQGSRNSSCKVQSVPLDYARRFERQAQSNHGQTIDGLNSRGGLDPTEFYAVVHGRNCFDVLKDTPEAKCIEWLENEFGIIKELDDIKQHLLDLKNKVRENLPFIFQYLETKRGIQDQGDPSRYLCGRAYKDIANAIGFDYELEQQQKG